MKQEVISHLDINPHGRFCDMRACMLSCFFRVRHFVTLWSVAHQAALSTGFPRQEFWSELPCPPPGDLPDPRVEPAYLMSPALAQGFFTTSITWEALDIVTVISFYKTGSLGGGERGGVTDSRPLSQWESQSPPHPETTFKALSKPPFSYFPRDQPHMHFISSLGAQYLFCTHFFHVTEYSPSPGLLTAV